MSPEFTLLFQTGQPVTLAADETLFHTGAPTRFMYLVNNGEIELVRFSETGIRMVLCRCGTGQVLAEASLYSPTYHCDGIALTKTELTAVPRETFRQHLLEAPAAALAWSASLARSLQNARLRAEIRGLRTVSERLSVWLEHNPLPARGQWQTLAQEIGVSREALYRELSKRGINQS